MAAYDLQLAEELAVVASSVERTALMEVARERMRLYLALLSLELSLKSMLEQAGVTIQKIRNRSHNIKVLLDDLDECTIEVEVSQMGVQRVPASRLRAVVISTFSESGTVGQLVDSLDQGVSIYPNEVRYGAHLRHFDAALVADAAEKTVAFAKVHWSSLAKK